jgi:hypothetical protein
MKHLIDKWRKDADQYSKQVDEARAAGTSFGQMLAMSTTLRLCALDLEKALKHLEEAKFKPGID